VWSPARSGFPPLLAGYGLIKGEKLVESYNYTVQENLLPLSLDIDLSPTDARRKKRRKSIGIRNWDRREFQYDNMGDLEHLIPMGYKYLNHHLLTYDYVNAVTKVFGFNSFEQFVNDDINLEFCDSYWNQEIKSNYLMPVGWYLSEVWKNEGKKIYQDKEPHIFTKWLNMTFDIIFWFKIDHFINPYAKTIIDPLTGKRTSPLFEFCYACCDHMTEQLIKENPKVEFSYPEIFLYKSYMMNFLEYRFWELWGELRLEVINVLNRQKVPYLRLVKG